MKRTQNSIVHYNLYHETIQPGLWPKAIMWRVMEVNALI